MDIVQKILRTSPPLFTTFCMFSNSEMMQTHIQSKSTIVVGHSSEYVRFLKLEYWEVRKWCQ